MEVACVQGQRTAKQDTDGQTSHLPICNFTLDTFAKLGITGIYITLFIVSTKTNRFNKRAFSTVVGGVIKEIVVQIGSTSGTCGVHFVAHVAIGVVVWCVALQLMDDKM